MLKSSLLFKENTNNSRILRIRIRNFQGIFFIWTRTYSEIFKSALVYLYNENFLKKYSVG